MPAALPPPTGFGRHAAAAIGAPIATSVMYAAGVAALMLSRGASPELAISVAGLVCLGVLVFAVPAAALVFTALRPLLRRPGPVAELTAIAVGAAAGGGLWAALHAAVGKAAASAEIATGAALGGVTGFIYLVLTAGVGSAMEAPSMPSEVEART